MRQRPRLHHLALRAAIAAAAALAWSHAEAQSFVRAECRSLVSAARLDPSPVTARWYKRFWSGECGGLRGCVGGSPNWNEVVGKLIARSAPAERPIVLARACRLGPLIGQEWTRPRKVRRIDSGDLRNFKTSLESAGEVLEGIARVEARARAKIGRSQE